MEIKDPKESANFIANVADHVKINDEGVEKCAQEILKRVNDKRENRFVEEKQILPKPQCWPCDYQWHRQEVHQRQRWVPGWRNRGK